MDTLRRRYRSAPPSPTPSASGVLKTLAAIALAVVIMAAFPLSADIIHLKNGNALRGKIIRESPDGVVLEVPYGEIRITREEIESIERENASKYYDDEAKRLLDNGDYYGGVNFLRKAIKQSPNDTAIRDQLQNVHLKKIDTLIRSAMFKEARIILVELVRDGASNATVNAVTKRILETEDAIDQYITRTIKEMDSGRFDDAINRLEVLVGASPQLRAKISLPLARSYMMRGSQQFKNHNWEQAADAFGRAMALDPQRVAVLGDIYITARLKPVGQMIQSGKMNDAMSVVEDCLTVNPINPNARLAAGIITEHLGLYPKACTHYAIGLGETPPRNAGLATATRLRKKLMAKLNIKVDEKAQDAWERAAKKTLPGDWHDLETPHFLIKHHNADLAVLVADAAEFHYTRITNALSVMGAFNVHERIPLYIFRNANEYRKQAGVAEWSGGVSQIRGRPGKFASSILTYQKSSKFLRSTLAHELLHVVMFHLTNYSNLVPLAIHEGTAVYFEPTYQHNYYRSILRGRLDGTGLYPAKDLFTFRTYPADEDIFYAQSLWVVRFLISLRGFDEYLRFVLTTADKGMPYALKTHYGIDNFDKLDQYWLSWMRKN